MADYVAELKNVSFTYPEGESEVFSNLSLMLPTGVTSLMGQNGSGKSTFMLLASGRIKPVAGDVNLLGQNTRSLGEEELQPLASMVYQNMEFETDQPLGELLDFVFDQGFTQVKSQTFLTEVIQVFELEKLLGRKTQVLAKGEMQRAVMAFSLLYGARTVFMDEPVFALEDRQKHRCIEYLSAYARTSGRSFVYSVHEFELGRKYADHLMLFYKNRRVDVGPMAQLFTQERIEEAYQVPFSLLHQKEHLYREKLQAPSGGTIPQDMIDRTRII